MSRSTKSYRSSDCQPLHIYDIFAVVVNGDIILSQLADGVIGDKNLLRFAGVAVIGDKIFVAVRRSRQYRRLFLSRIAGVAKIGDNFCRGSPVSPISATFFVAVRIVGDSKSARLSRSPVIGDNFCRGSQESPISATFFVAVRSCRQYRRQILSRIAKVRHLGRSGVCCYDIPNF